MPRNLFLENKKINNCSDGQVVNKNRISQVFAFFHRKNKCVSPPTEISLCLSPEQKNAILDAEKEVRECAKHNKISHVCVGTNTELVNRPWASEHPVAAVLLDFVGSPNGWQDWEVTVPVETKNYQRIEAENTELAAARVKFFETVERVISELIQTHEHLAGLKANREDSIEARSLKVKGNLKDGERFEFAYSLPKSPPIKNTPIMYHEYSLMIGQKKVKSPHFKHAEILISEIEAIFFHHCLSK